MKDGRTIPAVFLSVPTKKDPAPILHDFAVLRLPNPQKQKGLPFYKGSALPDVGTDVFFSGYPLGAPAMLTHKGMISGIEKTGTVVG